MQPYKRVISSAFMISLSAFAGSATVINDKLFPVMLMILVIVIGIKIYKKLKLPLISLLNTRIIESLIILGFPLILIVKWIWIIFLVLGAFIVGMSAFIKSPNKEMFSMKYILSYVLYFTFINTISYDKFIEYRIWILIAYYLWSSFYIWKLQVVEYEETTTQ